MRLGSSRVNEYSWKENYYTTNIYSDYFKQFDNGHYFKVMAGFNAEYIKPETITAEKNTLITPGVPTINTATDDPQAYGGYADNSVAGFFARVNWSYKDRYMFELMADMMALPVLEQITSGDFSHLLVWLGVQVKRHF